MIRCKSIAILGSAVLPLIQMSSSQAAAPNCYPYGSSGYCEYHGRVARVYVNAWNQMILYFDTTFDPAIAGAVGISGVSINNAAIYNNAANPDFAKALLASLLSAQARGATVSVQMSASWGGYLLMDRIWVDE
jgi:hypothetical protein